MRLPRYSIASLLFLITLIAVDLAWFRHSFLNGYSMFGFGDVPAFDTGVVSMANVLVLGLVFRTPNNWTAPWFIGFEVGGLVAIAVFIVLGWTWPDGVRLWLRPIYMVGPYSPSPAYLYLADTALFLPVQLLVASCVGLLVNRAWRSRA